MWREERRKRKRRRVRGFGHTNGAGVRHVKGTHDRVITMLQGLSLGQSFPCCHGPLEREPIGIPWKNHNLPISVTSTMRVVSLEWEVSA